MGSHPSRILNVAIVGCGWVAGSQITGGFNHLKDRFAMSIACDVDAERAAAFAVEHSISGSQTSYASVLADETIDVVSICTPPSLHYRMVMDALAAGKNVICEKPFTSSLLLVDEIIAAEQTSNARVMPIFQYRFEAGFQRIRHLLDTGIAGKPYIASVETAWKRGASYYSVPWRGKFATELGGVLVTQSIHIHDLFLSLFGDANSVKAFKTTRVNDIEVEDCAVAALRMENGSLATLTATLGSQEPVTRIRLCFENLTIERQCFGIEAKNPGCEPWTVIPANDEVAAALAALPEVETEGLTGFAAQFAAFHEALATDSDFPVTLAEARRSLELVSALYHASETDETVALPMGPSHPRYDGWISERSRPLQSVSARG